MATMTTRLLASSVFVYERLIMSVSRERQCDSELRCGIGLYLVEKICHLQGVEVCCTACNPIPSVADGNISTEILCFVIVMKVLFGRARRLFHALLPNPHERVLRYGTRLGFSDNLDRIDSVSEQ